MGVEGYRHPERSRTDRAGGLLIRVGRRPTCTKTVYPTRRRGFATRPPSDSRLKFQDRRFRKLGPVVLVIDCMPVRQHGLMQDTGNQNAAGHLAIKNDMFAALESPQPRSNLVAVPPQCRIISQHLATNFHLFEVQNRLSFAPFAKGVIADAPQVGLCSVGKTKCSHSQRRDAGSFKDLRTRRKTSPFAAPLASPSSIAARSAASFASYRCSSRSKWRNPARTTSLAFSYRPALTFFAMKRSSSVVKLTFRVGMTALP